MKLLRYCSSLAFPFLISFSNLVLVTIYLLRFFNLYTFLATKYLITLLVRSALYFRFASALPISFFDTVGLSPELHAPGASLFSVRSLFTHRSIVRKIRSGISFRKPHVFGKLVVFLTALFGSS